MTELGPRVDELLRLVRAARRGLPDDAPGLGDSVSLDTLVGGVETMLESLQRMVAPWSQAAAEAAGPSCSEDDRAAAGGQLAVQIQLAALDAAIMLARSRRHGMELAIVADAIRDLTKQGTGESSWGRLPTCHEIGQVGNLPHGRQS